MLSYSIEPYKRTDEQCSSAIIETKSRSNTYGNSRRYRRALAKLDEEAKELRKGRKDLAEVEKESKSNPKKYKHGEIKKSNLRKREKETLRRISREATLTLETLRTAHKSVEKQEAKASLKDVLKEMENTNMRVKRGVSDSHEEEDKNVEVEAIPPPEL